MHGPMGRHGYLCLKLFNMKLHMPIKDLKRVNLLFK
jgi:hypothetical protein